MPMMTRRDLYCFEGERLTLTQIIERVGVAAASRLMRDGQLNVVATVSAIPDRRRYPVPVFTWQGRTLTIAQWSKKTGLPAAILTDRLLSYRWEVERALTEPVIANDVRARKKRNVRIVRRIASTLQTGGQSQTFAKAEGTGVGSHETYFERASS